MSLNLRGWYHSFCLERLRLLLF